MKRQYGNIKSIVPLGGDSPRKNSSCLYQQKIFPGQQWAFAGLTSESAVASIFQGWERHPGLYARLRKKTCVARSPATCFTHS